MINIPKCIKSFKYAFKGIVLVFQNENNSKIHLLASLLAISGGLYFQVSKSEWLWIVLSIALVWICEAVNSALEKLVDLVSPGFNTHAGAVKDIAAGAVLIAALFAAVTGMIIFLPKIMAP